VLGFSAADTTKIIARLRSCTAHVVLAMVVLVPAQVARGTVGTFAATHNLVAPLATPPCNSSWNVVASATPGSSATIGSMAALSSNDVWGVGGYSANAASWGSQPLAEHWDGSNWNLEATPNLGGNGSLNGVSAVPGNPNDVYAVGVQWATQSSVRLTLTEHWNGSAWSVLPSPNPTNDWNQLDSVVAIAANDVWAVGYSYGPAGNQTLTEHFDGVSWTLSPSPNVAGAVNRLVAVSATGPSDVWAAANQYFEHWNGSTWSIVTSSAGSWVLSVLAISPVNAWAAGAVLNRTLIEHWDGTSWNIVPSPNSNLSTDNELFSISGITDNNIWTAGIGQSSGTTAPLTEHWNGSTWSIVSDPTPPDTDIYSVVASSPTNVWTAGFTANVGMVMQNLCISKPAVSGLQPVSGNTSGGTQIIISGSGFTFASDVKLGSASALSFAINSDSQITAVSPAGSVASVDVSVTNYAGPSGTTPADIFLYVPAAVSWEQYTLVGSDGATWKDIDATNLNLTLNPPVDSNAIVSGNADLWTALPEVNQDIGIFISGGEYGAGQVYAWKESGGFAGTFSPNAAFVQTIIPLTGGLTYTVKLEWKANRLTSGEIFAAAGSGPAYSPTRLTAQLLPSTDPTLESAVTAGQYTLTGSDGSTWHDLDTSGANTLSFTTASNGSMLVDGNVDLWTETTGVNQDIGVFVAGGAFGSGQVVGWKESGGFAGTFSPNAAYVQAVVAVSAGTTYSVKLQWKANVSTGGIIHAGAGVGPQYSPTRITLHSFTGGTRLIDADTSQQYATVSSAWLPMDPAGLTLRITPAVDTDWILGANADLWTTVSGVNQDVGIFVSGGELGVGRVVAWKESGGFAGTYSPNAAFVQTVIRLRGGLTYSVSIVWKTNRPTSGLIYAGAGPGPQYSPTRVTAQLLGGS